MTDGLVWEQRPALRRPAARRRLLGLERRRRRRDRRRRLAHPPARPAPDRVHRPRRAHRLPVAPPAGRAGRRRDARDHLAGQRLLRGHVRRARPRGAARHRAEHAVEVVLQRGAERRVGDGLRDGRHARRAARRRARTRGPVRVTGTASDPQLINGLELTRSQYEGPTGIVGVLHDACRAGGLRSASLWAPVPHYVATPPNPPATRALLERFGQLADLPLDLARARPARRPLAGAGRPRDPRQRRGHRLRARARGPRRRRRRQRARHRARRPSRGRWLGPERRRPRRRGRAVPPRPGRRVAEPRSRGGCSARAPTAAAAWCTTVVRVVTGVLFVTFSLGKFVDHAAEAADFEHYGIPAPEVATYLVGDARARGRCAARRRAAHPPGRRCSSPSNLVGAIATAGRVDGGSFHLGVAPDPARGDAVPGVGRARRTSPLDRHAARWRAAA